MHAAKHAIGHDAGSSLASGTRGGSAGLSAAWRLNKQGFKDFVVLEMNEQFGAIPAGDKTSQHFTPAERLSLYACRQEGLELRSVWLTRSCQVHGRENLIHKFRASGEFAVPVEREEAQYRGPQVSPDEGRCQ